MAVGLCPLPALGVTDRRTPADILTADIPTTCSPMHPELLAMYLATSLALLEANA